MGGWAGIWTSKINSLLYTSLWKGKKFGMVLSWLWVKMVVVLGWRENSSLGVNSSAPVFANVISEITQGHRVSGRTGRPGCYRSPVLRGPAISRSCVLSQDLACWFLSVPFDQVPLRVLKFLEMVKIESSKLEKIENTFRSDYLDISGSQLVLLSVRLF